MLGSTRLHWQSQWTGSVLTEPCLLLLLLQGSYEPGALTAFGAMQSPKPLGRQGPGFVLQSVLM